MLQFVCKITMTPQDRRQCSARLPPPRRIGVNKRCIAYLYEIPQMWHLGCCFADRGTAGSEHKKFRRHPIELFEQSVRADPSVTLHRTKQASKCHQQLLAYLLYCGTRSQPRSMLTTNTRIADNSEFSNNIIIVHCVSKKTGHLWFFQISPTNLYQY